MSDFTKEFDEIFKDVVGKFDVVAALAEEKEVDVETRYDEFCKDLITFTKKIMRDKQSLEMYGIHHVLHYIQQEKNKWERETVYTCKCGTKYNLDVLRVECMSDRQLKYLKANDELVFDPFRNQTMVYDSRFCMKRGNRFMVTGKILGVEIKE